MRHNIRRARFGKAYATSAGMRSQLRKMSGVRGYGLYFDRQGRAITPLRWMDLQMRRRTYGQIARTDIGDDIMVSTIWTGTNLGIDRRLEIFETMAFGGAVDQWQWRWSSERDAQQGHDNVVRLARLSLVHPEEFAELSRTLGY